MPHRRAGHVSDFAEDEGGVQPRLFLVALAGHDLVDGLLAERAAEREVDDDDGGAEGGDAA